MRFLRFYIPLSLVFTALFAAVYGGASWLSAYRNPPPAPHFAFEAAIPFVPAMAWIYLSVPLALVLTPLVLRTKREVLPFFFTLTAQLLAAGLCYLIYPVAPAWPPRVVEGPSAGVFHLADLLNLDYNELPSLHLAFAVSVAFVFGRRYGPAVRLLLWIWVLAVGASTLMLHEHHTLDVLTGIALGILSVVTVQRWTERPKFLDALQLEALCLGEVVRFARRHPRYLLTGLAIWSHSLGRWRETRLLRTGFCLTQHLDDVLDGDRPVPGDPIAYARGLLDGVPGPLTPLAAFVLAELERRGARGTLDELVEVLILDRRRMDARRTMSAAALADHHRKTFRLSLDLTLIAAGSELRAEDAPEIVEALAWCSPVRDLEEDLAKGLINVPAEVLAMVPPGVTEPRVLLAAEPVKAWLRVEHGRAVRALAAGPLGSRLRRDPHPQTPSPTRTHTLPGEGAFSRALDAPSEAGAQDVFRVPPLPGGWEGVWERGLGGEGPGEAGFPILTALHRALAAYEKKYRRRHPDLITDVSPPVAPHAHREAAR